MDGEGEKERRKERKKGRKASSLYKREKAIKIEKTQAEQSAQPASLPSGAALP